MSSNAKFLGIIIKVISLSRINLDSAQRTANILRVMTYIIIQSIVSHAHHLPRDIILLRDQLLQGNKDQIDVCQKEEGEKEKKPSE